MYNELFNAWRSEEEQKEMQALAEDFYQRAGLYLKQLMEEIKILDEKTVKSRLAHQELDRATKLLKNLFSIRYRKMLNSMMTQRKTVEEDNLVKEEKVFYSQMSEMVERVDSLPAQVLEEKVFRDVSESKGVSDREIIRLLQDIPAIMGVDMKKYGPFKAEDVALVRIKNVDSLINRGFAKRVVSREDT